MSLDILRSADWLESSSVVCSDSAAIAERGTGGVPSDEKPVRVLLVAQPCDTVGIHSPSSGVGGAPLVYAHASGLDEALQRLDQERFDIILLDLFLRDSGGISTLIRIHTQEPDTPVIVLADIEDEALALRVVQEGAQDYLVKPRISSGLLGRAIRYAIERNRIRVELRARSFLDELTGIYNRRGFFTLARQQLKRAERTRREMVLLFADLDGLKRINDQFGHHEGDLALMEFASLLKGTFRESDIVARMGGDEFAVLALEPSVCGQSLIQRVHANLEVQNRATKRRYRLAMSLGMARYDAASNCSVEEFLAKADTSMYAQRYARRAVAEAL